MEDSEPDIVLVDIELVVPKPLPPLVASAAQRFSPPEKELDILD